MATASAPGAPVDVIPFSTNDHLLSRFEALADREQVDAVLGWLRDRAPLRAGGQTFGAARGKNLIVVQVESLQDFAVDFTIGNQEVMPHLRRWSADSLRFTNVTDQTSEGRTSDAEFTTMTSLLPVSRDAVGCRPLPRRVNHGP